MRMSSDNKEYKYYVAWCYKAIDLGIGFGSLVMHSTKPLLLESETDMAGLINYISQVVQEQSGEIPDGLTIMDWRPIK